MQRSEQQWRFVWDELRLTGWVQGEHEAVRSEMEKEAMRAAKLEQRLAVLTKGYVMREAALRNDIEGTWQAIQTAEQVGPSVTSMEYNGSSHALQ